MGAAGLERRAQGLGPFGLADVILHGLDHCAVPAGPIRRILGETLSQADHANGRRHPGAHRQTRGGEAAGILVQSLALQIDPG